MLCKKAVVPSKIASQLREELNLKLIHIELNQEQGVVNQALVAEEQHNVLLEESEEVEYEESENDSDWEGPRRREMRAIMATLIDQNQMLVEII